MQRFQFSRFTSTTYALGIIPGLFTALALGQSSSGTVNGVVKDPMGAALPGAVVVLENPVSGYTRTAKADETGQFRFYNVPFNPYRLSVTSGGFALAAQNIEVESALPLMIPISLRVAGSATSVTVETSPDLLENDPHFHTDIDRSTIERLPVESPSSELSSIVTELSPGVAADSNGLLHGLGDHNEVSFSIDGQPITDQQSKVFSNQVPAAAIQSLEVIEGAPPAEYGDKTSLVIVGTTRSGQGVSRPTGTVSLSYGSFGTSNIGVDLAYGTKNFGNFFAANVLESGRFLDAPEFAVYHDKGNEENLFDRVDFQLSPVSSIHTNLQYTRSWFQTPNSYDTQLGYFQNGMTPGATDQRSKIETFDIAPTYTRLISDTTVFNFAPYIRRDAYNYYPSNNMLADLGPIQQEAVAQQRSLTNAGVHSDISYVKGHQNIKFGGMYEQTFLRENDQIGLVDPTLNDPAGANFNPVLAPYDLTRGGTTYAYHGQTDVKQLALYGQDQITAGHWLFNLGLRGDFYNGLSVQRQAEPRVGISYNIKQTGTVLRVSYARTQETPFNENLVLSSQGCLNPVIQAVFLTLGPCNPAPFNPGFRNEFHAGLQQSIGHHFVFSGDYITKYTHNAYDFSVLGATPITFPIEWHNSKIPGFSLSGTLTEVKGLTARVTMSSVAARFFNPQIGGVGATVGAPGGFPFRIDHDERFNQTTHLEYKMPFRKSLYYSFNWKFDSGLVAGSTPCYNVTDPNSACGGYSFDANGNPLTLNGKPAIDLSSLTADEEFQAGLVCDGVHATQINGFSICDAAGLTSKLINIPAPGTEDDDHHPQRIANRNLFDMQMGDDQIIRFGGDRYRIGARLTAINVTNKYALYNFLSTFSGTHYVSPRTITGEIAFHF
ncbi:TonB-dependent receptor [Granulicella tundricola]|uniref:TonB-dependent receptor plug n=1 Tax=Granulicella tundricola (strain ATCC BAA-1859 / DSM 23138 / MP5ACTX9) TaxID=1198114 RepID=E8WX35_GRATM|nr:TonB-dependent receptor [Granulicella tundricola]ADW69677.1 TonB-dependent receptor plug [Granulicella tundricola MP5ACTX9]